MRIAARSSTDTKINPARIERLEHTKGLRHFQRAVMGQHHTAAAHTDGAGARSDLTDHDLWGRAGKAGQVMMLCNPEAFVTQLLGCYC